MLTTEEQILVGEIDKLEAEINSLNKKQLYDPTPEGSRQLVLLLDLLEDLMKEANERDLYDWIPYGG